MKTTMMIAVVLLAGFMGTIALAATEQAAAASQLTAVLSPQLVDQAAQALAAATALGRVGP